MRHKDIDTSPDYRTAAFEYCYIVWEGDKVSCVDNAFNLEGAKEWARSLRDDFGKTNVRITKTSREDAMRMANKVGFPQDHYRSIYHCFGIDKYSRRAV
jgi:hypothetical protein